MVNGSYFWVRHWGARYVLLEHGKPLGFTVVRLGDGASCYQQGDNAELLDFMVAQIERLFDTSGRLIEQLDALLAEFDDVLKPAVLRWVSPVPRPAELGG